jgi:hypothetical protein
VDGEGKVAVHPPKEAFWWMAKAKATVHPSKEAFWWMARVEGGNGRATKKGTGETAGP